MKKFLLLVLSLITIFSAVSCDNAENNVTPTASPKPTQAPVEDKIISRDIDFYYPDEAVMYLVPVTMNVNSMESIFWETIVSTLIQGPVSDDLNPAIHGDVDVLSATVTDGICTVDLSSEFAEFNTGGSTKETMAIYSIVNTLCGIDGIDKVKINIEGNENADFGGHFDMAEPFEPNLDIVSK